MAEKKRWKIVLEYGLGILLLAAALAFSLLGPEQYFDWQDRQMMGKATLSGREEIEFLDTESLDIAGRLKLLKEAETYLPFSLPWSEGPLLVSEADLNRCRYLLREWCDFGLIPEEPLSWMTEETFQISGSYTLYSETGHWTLTVQFWFFSYEEGTLTVVADAETDILYYVGVTGSGIENRMAEELGYDSFEAMQERLLSGERPLENEMDYTAYDFASACGANYAVVTGEPGSPEMEVSLEFETFTGLAARRVICGDQGLGVAVMYGTDLWTDFVSEILGMYGFVETLQNMETWEEALLKAQAAREYREEMWNQSVADDTN